MLVHVYVKNFYMFYTENDLLGCSDSQLKVVNHLDFHDLSSLNYVFGKYLNTVMRLISTSAG